MGKARKVCPVGIFEKHYATLVTLDLVRNSRCNQEMSMTASEASPAVTAPAQSGWAWVIAPIASALAGLAVVQAAIPTSAVCGLSYPGTVGCFAPELTALATGATIAFVVTAALAILIGLLAPLTRRANAAWSSIAIVSSTATVVAARVILLGPPALIGPLGGS